MVFVKSMGITVETIVKDMPFEISHFIKNFHENSNTILLLACKSYISDQDFIIWIKT